ncbi:MAG: hypothetical protein ACTHNP_03190 [Solirubrobacterales bacterium]
MASASGSYVFDPQLSLTGSCATSKTDPVPDPGCPEGAHPPSAFLSPRSVVTDAYGDIFVASWGNEASEGSGGRIDVFSASGLFLTEILDPNGPKNLAVDKEGNLYVYDLHPGVTDDIVRYSPTVYEPLGEEIEYGNPPVLVSKIPWPFAGMAVNPLNGHLFVHRQLRIEEFGSAKEGNPLLDEHIGEGHVNGGAQGLAIDAAHNRLYATDEDEFDPSSEDEISIFELSAPHNFLGSINGAETPTKEFGPLITLAADEATGDLFVYDGEHTNLVYQFSEAGKYLAAIGHEFQYTYGAEIGIDNGPFSPHQGYLFVPSHPAGTGHAFAFGPPPPTSAPEVLATGFSEVSETDAQLEAEINPGGLATSYSFEYTTLQRYEESGFEGASLAGQGQIPAGSAPESVSALAQGLQPGTAYRFRVLASNEEGTDKAEDGFATYPSEPAQSCPNSALRIGPSAQLPDCRAYELVTPSETNARSPLGIGHLGAYFTTRESSPSGDKVSFQIEGGTLPGSEGTGSYAGDPYLATRGPGGWETSIAGPNAAETSEPLPGSTSPDQGYSFWNPGGPGTAFIKGAEATYLRYPDGHSALVGRGSLGVDPSASGKLISEDGAHVIFVSGNRKGVGAIQLEPNAPPDGTQAVYDRTADEVTHVVSLLPGNLTPAAGENAHYVGASLDGEGVAFEIGTTLYLRYNNEETFKIGENVTFAGIAEGGARIFYLKGGNLLRFDAKTQETTPFSTSGDVTPVNVSAEGSAAYLVSPSVLTGQANPNGAKAKPGAENLYLSREGQLSFVGILTERDVVGENGESSATGVFDGLGLWTAAQESGDLGIDPSRTTPDGSALLFQSRAQLTAYDSGGHVEVYRFDAPDEELTCISCNPTGAPAEGEASLQSMSRSKGSPGPFSSYALVDNLRADGRRAFFQSTEALVAADNDGLQDVYEWEAQGVGSCQRAGGCLYLISSGHSRRIDYLYAASDSGDDVFFLSADLLLPRDHEETPSIYDARVGGGFPEPVQSLCEAEACRPAPSPPPVLPGSQTGPLAATGKHESHKHCAKGQRRVVRHGRARCLKKRHRHRSAAKSKGAGK